MGRDRKPASFKVGLSHPNYTSITIHSGVNNHNFNGKEENKQKA